MSDQPCSKYGDVLARLTQVEIQGRTLENRLDRLETDLKQLMLKLDQSIELTNKAIFQVENISKRVEECIFKLSKEHDDVLTLRLDIQQNKNNIIYIQKDLEELNELFTKKIDHQQNLLTSELEELSFIKSEHNVIHIKFDTALEELTTNTQELRLDIADLKEKIADMEKVRIGWNALRYVGALIASAIGGVILLKSFKDMFF